MYQDFKDKPHIGILGFGEVGGSLCNIYREKGFAPAVKDLKRCDEGFSHLNVLNICIPYSENFVEIAVDTGKEVIERDGIMIIHSTVAPGTTREVEGKLQQEGLSSIAVGHSPIRGIHPHLGKGIKTFVKFVGANDRSAGSRVVEHLSKDLGLRSESFSPAETTELGKLLDTNYYALCVAFHGHAMEWCAKYGVNFDEAVTAFNDSYNKGYSKLGKQNVVRPILYPPQKDGGKIGGHCLVPNAKVSANDEEMQALWDFIKKFS